MAIMRLSVDSLPRRLALSGNTDLMMATCHLLLNSAGLALPFFWDLLVE
jgi:hypothetical protein